MRSTTRLYYLNLECARPIRPIFIYNAGPRVAAPAHRDQQGAHASLQRLPDAAGRVAVDGLLRLHVQLGPLQQLRVPGTSPGLLPRLPPLRQTRTHLQIPRTRRSPPPLRLHQRRTLPLLPLRGQPARPPGPHRHRQPEPARLHHRHAPPAHHGALPQRVQQKKHKTRHQRRLQQRLLQVRHPPLPLCLQQNMRSHAQPPLVPRVRHFRTQPLPFLGTQQNTAAQGVPVPREVQF